jgi:predicted HAD superfamily phosphohydrolase YqeG
VTGAYQRFTGLAELFARVGELELQTLVFDIEPLVAPWKGGQQGLDRGIAGILGQVGAVPSVRAVVFSTNSARRPSAVPAAPPGVRVEYLVSAAKPLRTAAYRGLPRPGAVIGDQLPTDGLLAYRLGYLFLHYDPVYEPPERVPAGPRLMHRWGRAVRPLLFRRPPA